MSGKLYLVATPIGNLEDITLRAIRILKEVDIIAAEDTRHSLKLLNGENIALITDAGTPAISDPGEFIVKKAIENNIEIIPIPGACALINALITSGLDTKEFSFYGFLPLNKKLRANKLDELKRETKTMILYEAPQKIATTLNDIYKNLGNVNIVLARELTKIHESFIRGKVTEVIEKIKEIKGEMIILIEGNNNIKVDKTEELSIEKQYELYKKQGLTKNEIIKKIAKNNGVKKNQIYMMFLNKEQREF